MRRSAVLIAVAVLATSAFAQKGGSASAEAGKRIFTANCANCHGHDGRGSAMGRSLGVIDFKAPAVRKMTNDAMKQIISLGRGNMPAWQGQLSPEEIEKVTAYVRKLQGGQAKGAGGKAKSAAR